MIKNNLCFELYIDREALPRRYRKTSVAGAKRHIVKAITRDRKIPPSAVFIKFIRGRYRYADV